MMRPYLRTEHRRRRGHTSLLQRILNYLTPFYEDLRFLWTLDAPYPFSLKVLITFTVCIMLILPPFYILVPPIFTIVSLQLLLGPELCPYDFWKWPPVHLFNKPLDPIQKKVFIEVLRSFADFFIFKSSLIVAAIDYIQMLRGIELELQAQDAN